MNNKSSELYTALENFVEFLCENSDIDDIEYGKCIYCQFYDICEDIVHLEKRISDTFSE